MENLYFLAITPPEELSQKIVRIQEDIAVRFGTVASLKVMPHITLKAPFLFPQAEHENVVRWFCDMQIIASKFSVELIDFDAFHNKKKPVIYIKPAANPALTNLQKQIILNFKNNFPGEIVMSLETNFHAHLTVAYRDLAPVRFEEAWEEFKDKSFHDTFEVESFHLLKHNGKRWEILKTRLLT